MISNAADEKAPDYRRFAIAVAIAIGGFLLFHFFGNATRGYIKTTSLFWWWISQWLDPASETEHGWLILGISGWMWWRNLRIADREWRVAKSPTRAPRSGHNGVPLQCKDDSRFAVCPDPVAAIRDPQFAAGSASPVSGFRAAVAAMILGLGLHAVGFVGQQTRVSIVALLIFTWGVLRLAGGRRWGNATLFPLAFMLFAIPLGVLDEIGLPLRLWVSSAGETIARWSGIEIVRNGTQLVAPDGRFNYDVAAPCSGVRSLMALMALAALIGYLNFRGWGRRALVFLLCFPLVYIGNVIRIVAIVFAAQWGGPEWGDRAHVIMGYGVFVVVVAGLLVVVGITQRWWPDGEGRESRRRDDRHSGDLPAGPPNRRKAALLAGAMVLGLTAGEMGFLHRISQLPPRGGAGVVLTPDGLNPVELPAFLGTEWIGQRTEISAVEREILPPDTGFSRKNYAFIADRTRDVFLSVVLSGRDRTSIHRPELCLVGQGWTIEDSKREVFRVQGGAGRSGGEFGATVLRIRREMPSARGKVVVPHLVAYWFVGSDAIVPSHWQRFTHDVWNRITRAQSDRWAYVLMQTDARDGEAAAIARLQTVLNGTLPTFQRLP